MFRSLLTFCLILSLAAGAFAAANVQEVIAGNGLKAWLIEDKSLAIVTVKMALSGNGSASDPKGQEGLMAFTMQMLDEGAGDSDALAFQRTLENHAIHFSTDIDEDSATVSMQTLSEYKGEAFPLLTLALSKPRFDSQAVERVRAAIISDLKSMEQNPDYLAARKWKEIAFAGTPYRHPKRGTPDSVASIKVEDLKVVANDFYSRPMTISVVGDITKEEVKNWLETQPAAPAKPALAMNDITLADGTAPILVKNPIPQTVVLASLPAVKRSDPRYYALTILNHILGGNSLTSRLGSEIRNKRGLAYYADSSIEERDHAAMLSIRFATRNEKTNAALAIFNAELGKLRDYGITPEELDDAKHYLTGSFPLQIDNQNALGEYLLAMQHYSLGKDYLEKRNRLINAVTLGDVNALAKILLSHAPLIVMVGNPDSK